MAPAGSDEDSSRLLEPPPPRDMPASQNPPAESNADIGGILCANEEGIASSSATPPAGAAPSSTVTDGTDANARDIIDVEADNQPPGKKQKTCTSDVWKYFTKYDVVVEVNGQQVTQKWARCNFKGCNTKTSKLRAEGRVGTTGCWTHLKNYHSIGKGQQQLKAGTDTEKGVSVVEPFRYNPEQSLKKLYVAIIMHEYPFNIVEHEYFIEWVKSLRPDFPLKSRVSVRKDIMNIYLKEKDNLYAYLKTIKCRFSATMDMWTSNQNKSYMCVTLHWIDIDWKIQKRIVNFFHVTGRHTGEKLSDSLSSCLLKWYVEKKMFSLTLDNAAANDVAVKDVILELKKHSPLICDGLFFHVRCANHILNLVARDGMRVIAKATDNIRAYVVAIKSSPLQWEEFLKCATECGLDTNAGLSLDVSTRWNSTYMMLRDVLYYKPAFERLKSYERRRYEKIAPSLDDWKMAQTLIPFLKKFFDLTELFSSTLYPTANLFFRGFCEIKILLIGWHNHTDPIICNMARSMTTKFDKYWKKYNMALVVANVLDPRYKRKIVEYYLMKLDKDSYPLELEKFNSVLKKMYQYYVTPAPSSKSKEASSAIDTFMNNEDDELDNFLYDDSHDPELDDDLNDLEKYLKDPPLKVAKADQHTFDILSWWKDKQDKYPTLSNLARDVLAMQASTVASESTFSSGGHVIDPFRSRLDPEMVQALICTRDWIAAARKGSKSISSLISDLEVIEAMENVVLIEEEDLISDDDGPELQLSVSRGQ